MQHSNDVWTVGDWQDIEAGLREDIENGEMAMIKIPFDPKFSENMDRTRSHGEYPCIICGRRCDNPRYTVHVHGGFSTIVTDEEAERLNSSGEVAADMNDFPIGPDCLKKHPEIRPYVKEQPVIKSADWKRLYFDLFRQFNGEESSDHDVMQDAYKRIEILQHYE